MNRQPHRLLFVFAWIATVSLIAPLLLAQEEAARTPEPASPASLSGQQTLEGWLSVIWGDPTPGSGAPGVRYTLLTGDDGQISAELALDEASALQLNGRRVQVSGQPRGELAPSGAPLLFEVASARRTMEVEGTGAAPVIGAQPWANLMCRFSGTVNQPYSPATIAGLFAETYPGLGHYWRQLSYQQINIGGTQTASQWRSLPRTHPFYVQGNNINFDALLRDCTAAHDAEFDYSQFVGINMYFNGGLGCCAWGGGATLIVDGVQRFYRATWIPSGALLHSLIAHEMGHGFGWPHSSGPSWNPPTGLSIYVSDWDVMSSGGGCAVSVPIYGCVAVGTISHHLNMVNWITSGQRVDVFPGETTTVTLTHLLDPPNSSALMARARIGGSSKRYYSVEMRQLTSYDQNVPGLAVIIHDVDVDRTGNAGHSLVVDGDTNLNVNDAGARWTAGETYTDSANSITIEVQSLSATSATVRITNNSTPIPYPEEPANLIVTSATSASITLGWDDESFNETGFRVYRWNGSAYAPLATVGANVTTYTHSGLSCGTWEYYALTAYNASAESPRIFSGEATTLPCVPSGLTPAGSPTLTASGVTLGWAAAQGADSYDVALGQANPPPQAALAVSSRQYAASDLLPGTYFWRVRARRDNGQVSAWSAVQSFTLLSPAGASPQRNFYTGQPITLTWNRISGTVEYGLEVARTTSFNAPVYSAGPLTTLSHTLASTLSPGTYYFRVRARPTGGAWGAWSAAERFRVSG